MRNQLLTDMNKNLWARLSSPLQYDLLDALEPGIVDQLRTQLRSQLVCLSSATADLEKTQ